MSSIEETIKLAGLEINKHTPKLVRVKGAVSQEILTNLLKATESFGIIDGSIHEESSQIFLFYGVKEPEPEPEIEEVVEEIVEEVIEEATLPDSTAEIETVELETEEAPEPEPEKEIPEE